MSDEVYVRWEPVNPLLVHQRLMNEINEQRKKDEAFIFGLNNSINDMKSKIYQASMVSGKSVNIEYDLSEIIKYDLFIDNEIVQSGFQLQDVKPTDSDNSDYIESIHAIDLSSFLGEISANQKHNNLKMDYIRLVDAELRNIFIFEEDIKEKNKLIEKINELIADETLDFAFFSSLIDQNLRQFFRNIGLDNKGELSKQQIEYLSLCKMFGEKPKKFQHNQLGYQIDRLKESLVAKETKHMFAKALEEVVTDLGMEFDGDQQFEGLSGYSISDQEIDHCSIFMSVTGNSLLFETIASVPDEKSISQEYKNNVENSAKKLCAKDNEIIRRMRDKGFILTIQGVREPSFKNIKKVPIKVSKKNKKIKLKEKVMV